MAADIKAADVVAAAKTVDAAADTGVTIAARLDRLPPSRHVRKLVTLLSFSVAGSNSTISSSPPT